MINDLLLPNTRVKKRELSDKLSYDIASSGRRLTRAKNTTVLLWARHPAPTTVPSDCRENTPTLATTRSLGWGVPCWEYGGESGLVLSNTTSYPEFTGSYRKLGMLNCEFPLSCRALSIYIVLREMPSVGDIGHNGTRWHHSGEKADTW